MRGTLKNTAHKYSRKYCRKFAQNTKQHIVIAELIAIPGLFFSRCGFLRVNRIRLLALSLALVSTKHKQYGKKQPESRLAFKVANERVNELKSKENTLTNNIFVSLKYVFTHTPIKIATTDSQTHTARLSVSRIPVFFFHRQDEQLEISRRFLGNSVLKI